MSSCDSNTNAAVPSAPNLGNIAAANTYPLGTAIDALSFTNSGGAPTTCALDTGQMLPDGLSVVVSDNGSTCVISGTPAKVKALTTYTVIATNAAGMSRGTVMIATTATAVPSAPNLGNIAAANTYPLGADIDALIFTNSGDAPTTCALDTGQTLPDGLNVGASDNGSTCGISGRPTMIKATTTYTVIATNATGVSRGTVMIATTAATAPSLGNISAANTYPLNTTIDALNFTNSGGAPTTCALDTGQTLPDGLSVAVSDDGSTCVISGRPTMVKATTTYTVIATNAAGMSMGTVMIATTAASSVTPVTTCAAGADDSTMYKITFTSTWSVANNGGTIPGGAHFSPLVVATHNTAYTMWEPMGTATPGIEQMAETGGTSTLRTEVGAQITANQAGIFTVGGQVRPAAGAINTTFMATCAYPLVSAVSMLAPSPDWFIGVHGISLLDDSGEWEESSEYVLYVYDAGTDSGPSFTSGNADITPHIPIVRLAGNNSLGFMASTGQDELGTMKFERITASAF